MLLWLRLALSGPVLGRIFLSGPGPGPSESAVLIRVIWRLSQRRARDAHLSKSLSEVNVVNEILVSFRRGDESPLANLLDSPKSWAPGADSAL